MSETVIAVIAVIPVVVGQVTAAIVSVARVRAGLESLQPIEQRGQRTHPAGD